ncbi:peptidoglycan-binding protein [Pedobacter sp. UC225_61]|uniref:peptidoglycan-binding protein n=1 Tax=Pedobacter sp. UC225_61 TaxID=3374623 RepID=UPI00379A3C5D
MATTRIIFGLLCCIGALGNGMPNRHLLRQPTAQQEVVAIATSQLGVKETGLNNHGAQVKQYLAYTHLKEGNSWCAAFVSWVFGRAGYRQPQTAWSPALFPIGRQTKSPQPGDVLGLYSAEKRRIVHCGLIERTHSDWVISIEGNTNGNGSSDGDGVYRKWRHRRLIAVYARWLPVK